MSSDRRAEAASVITAVRNGRVGSGRRANHPVSETSSSPSLLPGYGFDPKPGVQPLRTDAVAGYVPLWLCVHLPRLSLEAVGLTDEREVAAVVEEVQGRVLLRAVSGKALRQGLMPGMSLAAAYVLSPEIRIESRNSERERGVLKHLAERALAFTPWVSLDFDQSLLLEVRGSLGLFGGLERLIAKLRSEWSDSGHRLLCASALSPFAGWLLARSGGERHASVREELRSMLGALPTGVLGLDASSQMRLRKAGIQNLRDLWRLPRDGLARRYGVRLLALLDRAAGRREPPLRHFHLPPHFTEAIELAEETDRLGYVIPVVEQLVLRLTQFLIAHDAAVSEFCLKLLHLGGAATILHQGSRRPGRDPPHLMRLLQARLERVHLEAPVRAIELSSVRVEPWMPVSEDLFAEPSQDPASWQQLLDQVQARLGLRALRYFSCRADHRPEQASRWAEEPEAAVPAPGPRPLWLLPKPRAWSGREVRLVLPESERIESGWWDSAGIRRDYRRIIDRYGACLWVYRDLRESGRWFLHGLFG